MRFEDFIGASRRLLSLREDFRNKEVANAYLFTGPKGSGKRTLAQLCARALFCESPRIAPCDQCAACQRTLSGNHPDLLTLQPAQDKKTIGVDAVAELLEAVAVKPYEGIWRAVCIPEAGKLTEEAQNKLLKTIEEPPAGHVFLFCTDQPELLLPTIHSRCREVPVPPVSPAQAEKALISQGISPERAALLSRLSAGSIGRALEMNEEEGYFFMREKALQMLELLRAPSAVFPAFALAADCKDREAQFAFLSALELHARDLLAASAGAPLVQTDIGERLFELSRRFLPERLPGIARGVLEARKRIQSNVLWQAALEPFLFLCVEGLS